VRLTKLAILIAFTLGYCAAGLSQSTEVLEDKLKTASDAEEKMRLNYEIADALRSSNADKALQHVRQAHQLSLDLKNRGMAARSAFLTALIYERKRDERNVEVWLRTAGNYAKEAGDSDLLMRAVEKRGSLAVKARNERRAIEIYREAFEYFSQSGSSISDLEQKYAMQRQQLEAQKRQLEREQEQLKQDVMELLNERDRLTTRQTELQLRQRDLLDEKKEVEQQISKKEEELVTVAKQKAEIEQMAQESAQMVKQKEQEYNELSREALAQKAALAEVKLEAEQHRRNLIIAGLAALFFVLLALTQYSRYRASRRAKKTLEEKNRIIETERQRSEGLLLNILPATIAQELKQHGKAKARRFEEVTVLFADFKNFTNISLALSPEELVEELDLCFRAFDDIIAQYPDVEKIKTIGDAYMCASGLNERKSLPISLVNAALAMQEYLAQRQAENKRKAQPYFEARIGLHTGPVVAGVVGAKKFAYDIWGDTVNTAARVESNCEVGRVNISETTYRLIKYHFECHPRGKVDAKNIGPIDMYFVNRKAAAVPV
jgi:adenylate cyclase